MRIRLSEHFTYKKLIRFVLPTVFMMIVTSVYGIVDGFFVSNCVGKNAFAAVNLIMPVLMALGAFGFMIGTGGSALVAKTLGRRCKKSKQIFFNAYICYSDFFIDCYGYRIYFYAKYRKSTGCKRLNNK